MLKVVTLKEVLDLAMQLSLVDKVRLIEGVAPQIEQELTAARPVPRKSLWGLCADLGPAPSAEEIDTARQEAWADLAFRVTPALATTKPFAKTLQPGRMAHIQDQGQGQ